MMRELDQGEELLSSFMQSRNRGLEVFSIDRPPSMNNQDVDAMLESVVHELSANAAEYDTRQDDSRATYRSGAYSYRTNAAHQNIGEQRINTLMSQFSTVYERLNQYNHAEAYQRPPRGLYQFNIQSEEQKSGNPEIPIEFQEYQDIMPPVRPPIIRPVPPVQPQAQSNEEGIDPSFLDALPDDIRAEIMAQQMGGELPQSTDPLQAQDDFLAALPPDIREEVMAQQAPHHHAPNDMDNATFVASLTPDLRREVLLGATEEFLASLPPEYVAEAQTLQDRMMQRHHLALYDRRRNEVQGKRDSELKEISQVAQNERLALSIVPVGDSFLEYVIKMLYLISPVSSDVFISFMGNLAVHPIQRARIVDAIIPLLFLERTQEEFPPQQLYGCVNFIQNYQHVYAVVSKRVLDILQHLIVVNQKVVGEIVAPQGEGRLEMIRGLIGAQQLKGLTILFELVNKEIFQISNSHISTLINLIKVILDKSSIVPTLDLNEINNICSLLGYVNLTDRTMKQVIEIVGKLGSNQENLTQIVDSLQYQAQMLGQRVKRNLEELRPSGIDEIQLLRYCKLLNGLNGATSILDDVWNTLQYAFAQLNNLDQEAIATSPLLSKLLPVLEAFFLVQTGEAQLVKQFCEDNKRLINNFIKQNPGLLNDSFNLLIKKYSFLIEFDNKKLYFRSEIKKLRPQRNFDSIRLQIRRSQVFMDSFHQIRSRSRDEMYGRIRVLFNGEEGMDAGGLTREWFTLLSKELFNPNYALFVRAANGVSFQPNSMSTVNDQHLEFFKFSGRAIGKALTDGYYLEVYFTRSFYKHILGQEVTYQDMEDLDPEFYKSMKYLQEINLDEHQEVEFYFTHEESEFGRIVSKELIENGSNIRVDESNKIEYIRLMCEAKMTLNIKDQIRAFLEGFYEMVPKELISIFDSKELELLISGLPEIDLNDLKVNTVYHGYTPDSQVITWFWEVLQEYSQEELAEFIQFVTGSSKVPLEGFQALPGMGGVQKFQIHKIHGSNRLPTAHTCMNQLDLPDYDSKAILMSRLRYATREGKEGFGFV